MHEKLRLATVQPPFPWFEKKETINWYENSAALIVYNHYKPKRRIRGMVRPLPENTGSGRGGVAGYKSLTVPPVLLTLPLPSSLPLSPPSITCIFLTQAQFLTSNGEE